LAVLADRFHSRHCSLVPADNFGVPRNQSANCEQLQ
jgi:hypothetical protein